MPDAIKAANYIQQLDDARCEENWDAVPELVRKVRKHAPDRTCLTLTAEIELAITRACQKAAPQDSDRPSTAGGPAVGIEVAGHIPNLITAIENETQHPQESFQAKVCLGWLHWVMKDYPIALVRLPKNFDLEYPQCDNLDALSEWTKVCALKSAYLRANCLARDGQRDMAMGAFEAALPSLSSVWTTKLARHQLRYWAELFLTEYCMLASQAIRENDELLSDPNCLASFRTWNKYWASAKGQPLAGGYGFRGSVPRRKVWSEYYHVLSELLQRDLPFPTGYSEPSNDSSARSQLRAELKKAEIILQGLLYTETKFPRADEQRTEVEQFVDRVMQNWIILNGHGWKEQDLGKGGRDTLSHGTLDTLYGAATKTYHSTSVLRHLFTVHLAVAEFDLAFAAFDSYLDIIKKGKARVAKTGHPEPGLDDDATMLETIAACIAALCRFGGRDAAEKAYHLGLQLENLLERLANGELGAEENLNAAKDGHLVLTTAESLPPRALALTYQAAGLANAQWARMTYESESRTHFQQKAVHCLSKSLSPELGLGVDVRGVFALGTLLAEQRNLHYAINLVKTALLEDVDIDESQELYRGPCWRERSLIPLWHLLALMLSAQQDYVMAARACEGAMEQFKDPFILFGTRGLNGGYRSEHLNEAGVEDGGYSSNGIVDEMDDFEKESLLEIKMTQLAILELVEGPTVAVNASSELLTLFTRLFGDLDQKTELTKPEPPRTAVTAVTKEQNRNRRASVFGSRSVRSGRGMRQSIFGSHDKNLTGIPPVPQAPGAPAIQVTNDENAQSKRKSHSLSRSGSGRRHSLRRKSRSGSVGVAEAPPPMPVNGSLADYAGKDVAVAAPAPEEPSTDMVQRVDSFDSNEDYNDGEASVLAEVYGSLLPVIHFSQEHSKRKRKAILIKVWLTIAGFYRRAGLVADAQQACTEAQNIVQALEAEILNDTTGDVSLREAGWGETKSTEELYADVWAEKGYLSVGCGKPYEARADFETALTHFPDHAVTIVGLSDILLDIYSEKLLPLPVVPSFNLEESILGDISTPLQAASKFPELPSQPLGLGTREVESKVEKEEENLENGMAALKLKSTPNGAPDLPPPHKATSLPLHDRLAARDRAYGLLSGLTKLGTGWNNSEAWFTLARAYEESGQVDKAKGALWWCVELEDGRGAREWTCVDAGGYVL
ncbi:hypothetical protein SMACR_00146 [Sordaria macrospora]|uniref:WGS project CABT00000000 data, contig 2.1 n=2 Tax=Sordaria macrospora TaxID=5147 RepID=F7VKA4_SORMK|nr:uncharacterized protein SMAC_00146 [Sordaria macrospora k-hell]KAA8629594.1 hypothetical protein SMACR_00146 [Sordaria macrospora]KAH7632260.1 hypothetical protein B0T09DRAFT_118315 [Sordaria sp. MPI-SDFR-AT-0083]WPJ63532.1 hypothetical protein SMAC4_00146 [Sordaria macrospora]CCC05931.1 unnamed protein product [Sordaria macrospora k-hell]